MAIVTISRGIFSGGKELAECVAHRLGYECISDEVLTEAARKYDESLDKLSSALTDEPGIFEGMTLERAHYLAYITSSLVHHAGSENLVYHGRAGHLLLKRVPHVLRVKATASMKHRVAAAMADREFDDRDQAAYFIQRNDEMRAKWQRFLYHVDWSDISLYDLVVDMDRLTVNGACEIVCFMAGREEYQATPWSRKALDDLILATDVRAKIASEAGVRDDEIEIDADSGIITISGAVPTTDDADKIRETVQRHPLVKGIVSHVGIRWTLSHG